MAREHKLTPSASSLFESMRDLGYSLGTAIADLIDNSISASATEIDICFDLTRDHPTLAIIDNGTGMSADKLLSAMRHGAVSPTQSRSPDDLGRFGLGLKTASFSQCRLLTVVSSQQGVRCAAEWNLDLVARKDDWLISILDDTEIKSLPYIDRLQDSGTVVIWRELDRLFEDESGQKRDEIVNEKLDIVEKHLALVFHQFLSGKVKGRKKLSISLNGCGLEPFDPFCEKNSATQRMPEEIVRINGVSVRMTPYILPHYSKLSAREYDYYQDRSDFLSNQGAYIYRSGRLMVWGDWFRLIAKGESTKFARVQIDFPNSLDESWAIDIKKSRARPPRAVRERLRQVIPQISNRSTVVHRGRGKKLFEENKAPVWERYADQGRIRYALNREHPLLQIFSKNLDDDQRSKLEFILGSISSSLPIEMIYSDFSTHSREMLQPNLDRKEVLRQLNILKDSLSNGSVVDEDNFREVMRSTRLFENCMDIAEEFIREEFE